MNFLKSNILLSSHQSTPNSHFSISRIRNAENLFNLKPDELAIVFLNNGKLTMSINNSVSELSYYSGIMYGKFGAPKLHFPYPSFEAFLLKVNVNYLQKLLSMVKYRPDERFGVIPTSQLVIRSNEEVHLFVKSLDIYMSSRSLMNNESLNECKLIELLWILMRNVKLDLDKFIQPFLKPNRVVFDALMEKHFNKNTSINTLAAIAGYSVSTFKRRFKETYNCSPGKWIQERRLKEAYLLLESSDKTISEVGYEVGFENPSHFIQAFKVKFGITPKRLQHNLKKAA